MKNNIIKIVLAVAVVAALAMGLYGAMDATTDIASPSLCILDFGYVSQ